MAMIKSLGLLVASILAAALSKIVVEEIGAWSPSVIRGLIKLAVGRLPESHRARFEEEWQSHVSEVPGLLGKLLTSAGFMVAAYRMAPSMRRSQVIEDWLKKLVQIEESHSKLRVMVDAFLDNRGLTSEEVIKLKPHLDQLSLKLEPKYRELHDQLAAYLSDYSAAPTSFARNLAYRITRRAIQENFDAMSRGAEEISKKTDEVMQALGNRRKN